MPEFGFDSLEPKEESVLFRCCNLARVSVCAFVCMCACVHVSAWVCTASRALKFGTASGVCVCVRCSLVASLVLPNLRLANRNALCDVIWAV